MFKINVDKDLNDISPVVEKNNWVFDEVKKINSLEVTEKDGYLSHLSNCIITINPVQFEEPTTLYSAVQKTLTTNKILVREALVNKNDRKDIKAGKVLCEVLISDEELSRAFIEQGGDCVPISTITLNNKHYPILEQDNNNSLERAKALAEEDVDKHSNYLLEALDNFEKELKKSKPSKKKVKTIATSMKAHSQNLKADIKDSIDVLVEDLNKDINSVKHEVMSTIQKLSFYKDAPVLTLGYKEENNETDYLNWYVNGGFTKEEKQERYTIFKSISERSNNSKLRDYVQTLKNGLESRNRNLKLENGALAINTLRSREVLSDGKNTSNRVIEMRLGLSQSFESHKVEHRLQREYMRIHFSSHDLMLLLRASKDEDFIFGTIKQFTGQTVPFIKLQNFVHEEKDIAAKFKGQTDKLEKLVLLLADKLENGTFKKADKENILSLMSTIENVLEETARSLLDSAAKSREEVADVFEDKLKTALQSKLESLPKDLSQKALTILR